MNDLDELSNEEIHHRLLDCMANLSITTIHRNVLTKRMRRGTAIWQTRRETAEYIKISLTNEFLLIPTSFNTYSESDANQRLANGPTSSFRSPPGDIDYVEVNETTYRRDVTRRPTHLPYAHDESLWSLFVTMLHAFSREYVVVSLCFLVAVFFYAFFL